MIKQKSNQKCTAVGKRRINLFKIEQAVKRQFLINQNQVRINQLLTMQIEDLAERVRLLEQEEPVARKGFLAWLLAKLK